MACMDCIRSELSARSCRRPVAVLGKSRPKHLLTVLHGAGELVCTVPVLGPHHRKLPSPAKQKEAVVSWGRKACRKRELLSLVGSAYQCREGGEGREILCAKVDRSLKRDQHGHLNREARADCGHRVVVSIRRSVEWYGHDGGQQGKQPRCYSNN